MESTCAGKQRVSFYSHRLLLPTAQVGERLGRGVGPVRTASPKFKHLLPRPTDPGARYGMRRNTDHHSALVLMGSHGGAWQSAGRGGTHIEALDCVVTQVLLRGYSKVNFDRFFRKRGRFDSPNVDQNIHAFCGVNRVVKIVSVTCKFSGAF